MTAGVRLRETLCLSCNRLVGVWQAQIRTNQLHQYPKTSRHFVNGRPCPGSLAVVHESAIMEVS